MLLKHNGPWRLDTAHAIGTAGGLSERTVKNHGASAESALHFNFLLSHWAGLWLGRTNRKPKAPVQWNV